MSFLIEKNELRLFTGVLAFSIVISFLILVSLVSLFFFIIFPWFFKEVKNKRNKVIAILWWIMLVCGFCFYGVGCCYQGCTSS